MVQGEILASMSHAGICIQVSNSLCYSPMHLKFLVPPAPRVNGIIFISTGNTGIQRVILDYFCCSLVTQLDRILLNLPKVASHGCQCYHQKNNTLCIHVQLLSYPVAAFCERLWNTCMTLLNWMRFDGRSWATAVLRNLKYFRSLFPPPTSKHRGLPRPCYTPGMHSLKKKQHTHIEPQIIIPWWEKQWTVENDSLPKWRWKCTFFCTLEK